MAKHMVVCKYCGRQFDANQKGSGRNTQTGRYICPDCFKERTKASKKLKREEEYARLGMRQTMLAMILKIVIGVFTLLSIAYAEDVGTGVLCAVIGLGLIAWGVIPYIKRDKGGGGTNG